MTVEVMFHLKKGSQNQKIDGQTKADKKGQKDKPRSTIQQAETKKSLKILMWVIRFCKTKRDRQ